jgi:hypothetical protein
MPASGGRIVTRSAVSAIALVWTMSLLGCAGTAATAVLRPTDVASTHAFLTARSARARSINLEVHSRGAAIGHYVANAGLRCRGIAASAPRGTEFYRLNYDALAATEIRMEQANARTLTRFAERTSGLRWSQAFLTRLVRRLVGEERALARVAPLDVCAMFAAWARGGYRAIPSRAERFRREIRALASRTETRCQPVPPNGRVICSVGHLELPTAAKIRRLLRGYEDVKQREVVRETYEIEQDTATRTRTTLVAAASRLTRYLRLDPFSLRLFVASLKQL